LPSARPAVRLLEPKVTSWIPDHRHGIDDAVELGGDDARGERCRA
jgi:hypothetical protein